MTVYLDAISSPPDETPFEGFVNVNDVEMYRISGFDKLPPFLIAVTSDSDLWMYVSSRGALTAGRVDYERSLFPYETEDRLHKNYGITGPITMVRVRWAGKSSRFWEPFSPTVFDRSIERNLYKTPLGNRLMFEEIHHDLKLTFRYTWSTSAQYGFVRTAEIISFNPEQLQLELLDGLLNILPAGVPMKTQQGFSCLADAYKYSEVDPESKLAIYSLTSLINDRPEPLESLTANTVWSRGLSGSVILSEDGCDCFRRGEDYSANPYEAGRRGAFLVKSTFRVANRQRVTWESVAEVAQDQVAISRLKQLIAGETSPHASVADNVRSSEENLKRIVGQVDGLQESGDHMSCVHHTTNVLFNSMRGGVPLDGGNIKREDFSAFVQHRSSTIHQIHRNLIDNLPVQMKLPELIRYISQSANADLIRLAHEYLPLSFSRRHGDPSRPWNRFAIQLYDDKGNRRSGYQGNWRDIFQNWEALGLSYPSYIESFIAKFVNASTVDGFNPYRVTNEGIDWEVPDPTDPWSHIGYWGDHQIIYLLRLLQWSKRFHPGKLSEMLSSSIFSYANVPYRIDSYRSITQNPRETIQFDTAEAARIEQRVNAIGADGKLLLNEHGDVYHVNLLEKLLVPLLSKLCNYVPDGGIWMNTQRPEWNDANNALAGYGLSVVTLAHLYHYVDFLEELLKPLTDKSVELSAEVCEWASRVFVKLTESGDYLDQKSATPKQRRDLMDDLGEIFEDYRHRIYGKGFSEKLSYLIDELLELLHVARRHIDHSLKSSRRADGLFHSYNLLDISSGDHVAFVDHLGVMLEGQVAILGANWLDARESQLLLDRLFESPLYREDQKSFMLYPLKRLGGFMDKNVVPENLILTNPLLKQLLKQQDHSIISTDALGKYRFSGRFQCRQDVKNALQKLKTDRQLAELIDRHCEDVLKLFSDVFDHSRFTGRSDHMFGYEGVGCIYWHMVSKLLLASHDSFWAAVDSGADVNEIRNLGKSYLRVRSGLELDKTAAEYGAFPTDPYSHTPLHRGAAQPGMTGRVKEEIITRFAELGLRIQDGCIVFDLCMLRASELLDESSKFSYFGIDDHPASLDLAPGMAGFTFAQVPVILHADPKARSTTITVYRSDGSTLKTNCSKLDRTISAEIFDRRGTITRLEVSFNREHILNLEN